MLKLTNFPCRQPTSLEVGKIYHNNERAVKKDPKPIKLNVSIVYFHLLNVRYKSSA